MHSLFAHRCRLERNTPTNEDGVITPAWSTVENNVACLLQEGNGGTKAAAHGNALVYSAILFLPITSTARPNAGQESPDRVVMTSPPRLAGRIYRIELAEDECGMRDHLTAYVTRLPGA